MQFGSMLKWIDGNITALQCIAHRTVDHRYGLVDGVVGSSVVMQRNNQIVDIISCISAE